jgi:hypothetical protein
VVTALLPYRIAMTRQSRARERRFWSGTFDRLLVAGLRPSCPAAATSTTKLHLGLLGDLQSIVNLDAEIPHGTFELRVSKQELYGPEVLSPPVNQCWLGASQ